MGERGNKLSCENKITAIRKRAIFKARRAGIPAICHWKNSPQLEATGVVVGRGVAVGGTVGVKTKKQNNGIRTQQPQPHLPR